MHWKRGGGGGWHKASVSDCLPLAAPIGLTTAHSDPLWVRTCFGCVNGAPGWLVLFDYSGGRPSQRRAVARAVDQGHPDAHIITRGLPTPAPTCARWGVHLQDHFPDRGF